MAGSLLGTMLSRSQVFAPAGKVWELQMYPMNFEEFLMALGKKTYITKIRECFSKNKKMEELLHDDLIKLYKIYQYIGGIPEAIMNFIDNKLKISEFDKTIVKTIINKYIEDMNQYVKNNSETLKIKEIYTNIGSQLGNKSHKFQASKIDKNKRLADYELAINWLYTSRLILRCYSINKPEEPIKVYANEDAFKLYASDSEILAQLVDLKKMSIFDDNNMIYKGILAENYVAVQLVFNGLPLYYWTSGNEAEIDFVVSLDEGVVPVEVNDGNNTKAKSLKVYIKKYQPKYGIKISNNNFSYDAKTKIKDIPLYAVFCIK